MLDIIFEVGLLGAKLGSVLLEQNHNLALLDKDFFYLILSVTDSWWADLFISQLHVLSYPTVCMC